MTKHIIVEVIEDFVLDQKRVKDAKFLIDQLNKNSQFNWDEVPIESTTIFRAECKVDDETLYYVDVHEDRDGTSVGYDTRITYEELHGTKDRRLDILHTQFYVSMSELYTKFLTKVDGLIQKGLVK